MDTFNIEALPNYIHETRLATFQKEHGEKFAYYNPEINDKNFSRVTDKIVPEQKFRVEAWKIKKSATSSGQCLKLMRQRKARFVGAQGLSILFEERGELLPKGFGYISLDEKSALPSYADCHGVPCVRARSDGDFRWNLVDFEGDWFDLFCLLCFCDLPTQAGL